MKLFNFEFISIITSSIFVLTIANVSLAEKLGSDDISYGAGNFSGSVNALQNLLK